MSRSHKVLSEETGVYQDIFERAQTSFIEAHWNQRCLAD